MILQIIKTFRETLAIAQRILTELVRRKRSLVFWIIFPITVLMINGLIFEERLQIPRGDAFAQAVPTSLVGAALFFSCLGGSLATVVSEREQKTLKRLFISPLAGPSYFLGIFFAHSLIGIGQTLIILIIAIGFGAKFSNSFLLASVIILLSMMTYVGVGFMLGTQLARRTEDANAIIAAFGIPLLLLGGAFLPTTFFPDSLMRLAHYNPVYHMNQALLGAMLSTNGVVDITVNLVFLVSFCLFVTVGGWVFYQRMLHLERRF